MEREPNQTLQLFVSSCLRLASARSVLILALTVCAALYSGNPFVSRSLVHLAAFAAMDSSSSDSGSQQRCPGCLESFSIAGLVRHFAMTTNPICIAAQDDFNARFEDDSEPEQPSYHPEESLSRSPSPMPVDFNGDYFGDYRDDDFQWPSEEDDSDSDEDDVSDPGWEPDPPLQEYFPPLNDEELLDNTGNNYIPIFDVRRTVEERLRKKPFIEHFPLSSAGWVYKHNEQNIYDDQNQRISRMSSM